MESTPTDLPVLPIRNAVLFPTISMPLVVGRERSLKALEKALLNESMLVVVTQKVLTQGDPEIKDLFTIGALCKIENVSDTESTHKQALVTGVARFRIQGYKLSPDGYLMASGIILP